MFLCKSGAGRSEDHEVVNMAAAATDEANFSLEEFGSIRKGGSADGILVFFGSAALRPNSGEYDYLPEYRKGRQQKVVLGFHGAASTSCNQYTGLQRIVKGSLKSAAKKYVQECFDNLLVNGTVKILSTEHRGTINVTDSDGTTIRNHVYFATMDHLNAEADLWFMQEGFRCRHGWWRKWMGQEIADVIQDVHGGVRVLNEFDQDTMPWERMPAHYRCWLPLVLEGNIFVKADVKMRGQTCVSYDSSIKNQKPGSFDNILSIDETPANGLVTEVNEVPNFNSKGKLR